MLNPTNFITVAEALAAGDTRTETELKSLAKAKGKCCVCEAPIWRYAGCGMCFSCTTGESDPSDDYELIP